jgi:putative membrane protein
MVGLTRHRLRPEDEARIEAAVADLERRSAAELVVVIAQRAAGYAAYPALGAACIALLTGWIATLVDPLLPAAHVVFVQGAVLMIAAALFYLTPLGIMLVPPAVKRARAAMLARLEFAHLVNDRTRERNGVLLFVALAEHYIEIIADDSVAAAIPPERWQQLVGQFQDKAKRGPLSDSLLGLIAACTAVLEHHFPAQPGQKDELPNQVREI